MKLECSNNRVRPNTYNKESSTQKYSLHAHIQVHREGNTKEICIGEYFACQTRPLF